jgi:hypothetical protein
MYVYIHRLLYSHLPRSVPARARATRPNSSQTASDALHQAGSACLASPVQENLVRSPFSRCYLGCQQQYGRHTGDVGMYKCLGIFWIDVVEMARRGYNTLTPSEGCKVEGEATATEFASSSRNWPFYLPTAICIKLFRIRICLSTSCCI